VNFCEDYNTTAAWWINILLIFFFLVEPKKGRKTVLHFHHKNLSFLALPERVFETREKIKFMPEGLKAI
jgi:hypothetical protein